MSGDSMSSLGVKAAELVCLGDPLNGEASRGGAQRQIEARGVRVNLLPGAAHPVGEASFDLIDAPPVGLVGLHPLEVRHDHTAGVGQDVGYDKPTGVVEH